ncbi:YbjN domain-containing protein [Enterovirga sp.]|uniref:YbjN domain-containing protein n=1 Tax=Enterovirga sp. TaxID=2026350 RepID=UPI00260D41D9|nr:YbjN domain-containing protein [Enterovirga sp.]MDB5590847.1 hypothetical protein [Enterovirga sp.]
MRALAGVVLAFVAVAGSAAASDPPLRPDPALRLAQQSLRPPTRAPAATPVPDGGLVDATDAGRLAGLMQSWGWLAKVSKDSAGDPRIESKISKSTFSVTFYGCDKGQNCTSVSLETAYIVEPKASLETINKWNREKRWGQAALNVRGNPTLSLAINLDQGVSPKNLESTFERWRTNVTAFEQAIGW